MTELYVNANSFPASRPRQVLLAQKDQAAAPATANALTAGEPTLVQNMDGNDPKWEKSNWPNGDPAFASTWRPSNVIFKDGVMSLVLNNKGCPQQCDDRPLVSGEYRTTEEYGYGLYQSRFKAAKGDGLVTSFFTFYATPEGKYMDNDEIDFEITGNKTSEVQINYYNDHTTHIEHPEGLLHQRIPLGFDASEGFHDYAILWTPKFIGWYIDGQLKHTETGSLGPLPTHRGKAVANLWAGTGKVIPWAGEVKYSQPVAAQYDSMTYFSLPTIEQAMAAPAPQLASAKPKVVEAEPAAPLNELAAVKEGLIIYKFLTRKDESRQLLSKPTAENTLKQGCAFAAVAGGLSKEEESVVFNLAEMGGLNSEKNYNTSADLIALLGGIDAGTVDVPDKGTGFSGESKRKIKEALVIYDLLTFKMHTRDLLSDETRKATLPGREPELGVSMSAVQVGGGITPKLFDVVTSLGNQYLSDRIGSADLDVLLGREQEIKARLCSVAQIGCDSAAGPGKKISVTAPTPAPEENKKLKKPFMDLDKLASDVVRDIAKKFGQSKHLSDSTPTKLHVGVTGMISGSEAIFGFYLEEGGFTKTYPLPAGYSEAEVERDRAYLGKVLANKPIILSKPAD